MHYTLEIKPSEDEEGEELGYFEFHLLDASVGRLRWYDGVVLEIPPEHPIKLKLEDMGGWCTVFADYRSTPVPLATARLRQALTAAGASNVQWFDTEIVDPICVDAPVYFAMNVVGSIAAVSFPKSISHRVVDAEGADIFERLVIDESRVTGLHIFRLAESVTTLVLSDEVKRQIEIAGIDTVAFANTSGAKA